MDLVIALIDISGSMGLASGKGEGANFSRLDLVKQNLLFCLKILKPETYFAIVSFSTHAKVELMPTQIKPEITGAIEGIIKSIYPTGTTNIGSGIEQCAKMASSYRTCNVVLLSDGDDNYLNEHNIFQFLTEKMGTETSIKIDAFGFGSDANTKLLVNISNYTNGTYALCYDASMVGTIMGRSIARIYLGEEVYGIQPMENDDQVQMLKYHEYRLKLVDILKNPEPIRNNNLTKLNVLISEVESYIQSNTDGRYNEFILNLYADMVDQIKLAVTSDQYWSLWGKAYWTTMYIALEKQFAPNFKDISLQHFGTNNAKELYSKFSEIYSKMDMVQPTLLNTSRGAGSSRVPITYTAATFNDVNGGCFHQSSILNTTLGPMIIGDVAKILQNEAVYVKGTIDGRDTDVEIETILVTQGSGCYYKINSCILTARHPIYYDSKWQHPIDVLSATCIEDNSINYNVILKEINGKRPEALYVNDELCVALGHGIKDNSVAEDPFWGTEKVITCIKEKFGNQKVIMTRMANIRDKSGYTINLIFDSP